MKYSLKNIQRLEPISMENIRDIQVIQLFQAS